MRQAFTLIELLVVVAIIAILAAILFPVFSSAKVAGKRTVCASNMRQIGLGLAMYANDWDGVLPETTHTGGGIQERAWIFTLRPYLANTDEVRICPADPRANLRRENDGTSYILNEYLTVEGPDAQLNMDAIPRPSETISLFIISDTAGVAWVADHTHSRNWVRAPFHLNWRRLTRDIQPDRHRQGTARWPHDEGSANYLYADTHVKSIPAARVRSLTERNVNIAQPPAP